MLHADVTVGNYDSGNCYPFMCNDSGTSTGVSIDYQQAYNSAKFSGSTTINSMSWYFASVFGGNDVILGGNYSFYWGYSAVGLGPLEQPRQQLHWYAEFPRYRPFRSVVSTTTACLPSRFCAFHL